MSTRDQAVDEITVAIAAELAQPLPTAIAAMAEHLALRGGAASVAVLFYGSVLRTQALDGVLDFYVLADSLRRWHRHWLTAAANRVLPPNILYLEHVHEGRTLRAKVAVLRVDQFQARTQAGSLDTTIWARYAQPAALVWARDSAARDAVNAAVSQSVVTAAGWAARLGPPAGSADDYWQALFRLTYAAELRVEKASRAETLTAFAGTRYATLLPLAWRALGIACSSDEHGRLQPEIDDSERRSAERRWALRRRLGKPLNFLRLVKSAYTFTGGVDYLLWKIERHSGVKMELSAWQRRHPILASPGVLWKLRKLGAIR